MEQINKEGNCLYCVNYTKGEEGKDGKCYIYDSPNYNISICKDWREL